MKLNMRVCNTVYQSLKSASPTNFSFIVGVEFLIVLHVSPDIQVFKKLDSEHQSFSFSIAV